MSIKFFLDADGGSLAFKKEQDVVSYGATGISNPVWISVTQGVTSFPTSIPTSTSIATYSQDVEIYRNGMLRLLCSDETATWEIQLLEGTFATDASGEKMCKMFNGSISGVGSTVIPVQVFMVKYLYVQIISLSTGVLDIRWAPAAWEEAE